MNGYAVNTCHPAPNSQSRASKRLRSRLILGTFLCVWLVTVFAAQLFLARSKRAECTRLAVTCVMHARQIDLIGRHGRRAIGLDACIIGNGGWPILKGRNADPVVDAPGVG